MSQIGCSLVDGTMWRDYNFHYQFNLNVLLNYFLFHFFVCYRDASFITCFVYIFKNMARSAQIWWIFLVTLVRFLIGSLIILTQKVTQFNFTESPYFIAPPKSSNLVIHATFLGRSFPPSSPDNNRPFDRQLSLSGNSQSTEIKRFFF